MSKSVKSVELILLVLTGLTTQTRIHSYQVINYVLMFCTIRVFYTIRVWYNFVYHMRTV